MNMYANTVSFILLFTSCIFYQVLLVKSFKYKSTWESLDKRPLPSWYDEAKIGIFIHWGVFSVPSFGSEWFWQFWKGQRKAEYVEFMTKNYPPRFTYQDFGKEFTAEFFNPNEWAELFEKSGAKYVVLTSKHHEGFTLWPSEFSYSWNAKDLGPHRDLVGELADAVRSKTKIHFGLYHSFFEWFNPMYNADEAANFSRNIFPVRKAIPEMKELVNTYKPDVFWSDGAGEVPVEYWQSREFLAWLYNESPVKEIVVVNDRWGTLQSHKWENAMTLDKHSWGYRRNAPLNEYLTTHELIKTLAQTVSCGGNLLVNIGPTKEGTIIPIFQERLLDLGTWLSLNGEAIYNTTTWTYQNDTVNSDVWYTSKKNYVYAIVLSWPDRNILSIGAVVDLFSKSPPSSVTLLENNEKLEWNIDDNIVKINLDDKALTKNNWAWVVKFNK
ncbi:plasma alpha-L-fucosidase-like isoform X2 [Agrilus planipennis]|uniref:alpha-L-fucosidase n=1 Tax=Agrilus planipennis TaxID=224129 RepID=A0A1W4XAG5_AGRPL|nr:plasma alpha-L-fucosidase-like isoform X2 [Agrilus planipennis]